MLSLFKRSSNNDPIGTHSRTGPVELEDPRRNNPNEHHTLPVMDDPTDRCCFNIMITFININHLLDFSIGLILLGYAIAISIHQPDPQHGLAIIFELWSVLLLLSSLLGTVGLNKHYFKRILLTVSGYLGVVNAISNVVFAFILLIQKEALFHYFQEKADPLFLKQDWVEFFYHHESILVSILGVHAFIEFVRFFVIQYHVKENLILHDRIEEYYTRRQDRSQVITERRRWRENPTGDDNNITTPLLLSPNRNNEQQQQQQQNKDEEEQVINKQWWEDEEDDEEGELGNRDNNDMTMVIIEQEDETQGWFSHIMTRKQSQHTSNAKQNNSNINNETNKNNHLKSEEGHTKEGSFLFSPIDEDLNIDEPVSEAAGMATSVKSSIHDDTSYPAWYEDQGDSESVDRSKREKNPNPDVIWGKEDD